MANLILGTEKVLGQETTVRLKEEKDVVLVAPTRSGYESKIFIPNLFLNKTNIIMFDYKGWHYLVSKDKREELGYKTINVNFYEEVDIDDILKKGDKLYLDGRHKDYFELFNKRGKVKDVLNPDGTSNSKKFNLASGRRLK